MISLNFPDLLNLAKDVQSTRTPRLLKKGEEELAMLTPLEPSGALRSPQLRAVAHRLAGSLADADIPGWESSEAAEHWVDELRKADMFPFESPSKP